MKRRDAQPIEEHDLWRRLRNRWEYSHVARAALGTVALLAILVATVA